MSKKKSSVIINDVLEWRWVGQAIAIKKSYVNLKDSRIWINRLKGGLSTEHPISGDELRAIKRYPNSREDYLPWLFANERGIPLTRQAASYIVSTIEGIIIRLLLGQKTNSF